MKYWNELDHSFFFNKIFSSSIAIGEIDLFTLTLDNNRPTLTLEFDIDEYPDNPPLKWTQQDFNTCRIGITCGNPENLTIKNIPTNKKLKIKISIHERIYTVTAFNDEALIEFKTEYVLLCDPSGYQNAANSE